MVLRNAELREQTYHRVEPVSWHFERDPYLVEPAANVIHWLSPPRTDPVIDAGVLPEDDVPDWGVRERPQANTGDGSTITDLRDQAREIISREVYPRAHKVRLRILLTCFLERGTRKV